MSAPTAHPELGGYLEVWSDAVDRVLILAEELDDDQWAQPTDLAGWSVGDVVAHLAHLEHLLAGGEHDDVAIGSPAHVTSPMDQFTEQGVVARRERSRSEVIEELRAAVATRRADLAANPPTDPEAPAPGLFGLIGWDFRTLLKNRPLDVWMHEQDVRRAVGQPGNLDTPAARHTVNYLASNLGYVLAKRLKAPTGTTVQLDVTGAGTWAAEVDENGRGRELEAPTAPDAHVTMSIEAFGVMAGGRRRPEGVTLAGDQDLGQRVVEGFHGLTP